MSFDCEVKVVCVLCGRRSININAGAHKCTNAFQVLRCHESLSLSVDLGFPRLCRTCGQVDGSLSPRPVYARFPAGKLAPTQFCCWCWLTRKHSNRKRNAYLISSAHYFRNIFYCARAHTHTPYNRRDLTNQIIITFTDVTHSAIWTVYRRTTHRSEIAVEAAQQHRVRVVI